MGAQSTCYSVLEDLSREDLAFASDHYGLSTSGTKKELSIGICDHIGRDIAVLVGKNRPFTVSFWNDLLDEHGILPCRSYQEIVFLLTVIHGSNAEYGQYIEKCDGSDEHPEFERFADSFVAKLHWHEPAVTLKRLQDLPDSDRGLMHWSKKSVKDEVSLATSCSISVSPMSSRS